MGRIRSAGGDRLGEQADTRSMSQPCARSRATSSTTIVSTSATMLRSLCLFPLIALTGALLNLLIPSRSTGSFWGDIVGWAAVGWWVPIILLPAAITLHV